MGRFPALSSEFCRQFLWLFISITATVGTGCGLVYYNELQAVQRSITVNQRQELEQKRQFVLSDFETAIADLKFLARESRLTETMIAHQRGDGSDRGADQRRLEVMLYEFLKNKRLYHQVRILDQTGYEIFRVNRREGETQIVPADQLQDKSDRPYFFQTQRLGRGEIYLSPFDLNVENGIFERPFVPVIRLATPLFNEAGEFQGILILNYLGGRLLRNLEATEGQSSALSNVDNLQIAPIHTHLLNGQGYWLNHHNDQREWGAVLPDRRQDSLPIRQPELWSAIRQRPLGHWMTEDQIYTFLKVPVLELIQDLNLQARVVVSHKTASSYNWRLLTMTPRSLVGEQMRPLLRQLGLILFGMIALSIPGLWSWLRARQQQQRTAKDLESSQQELEFHVRQADILNERLASQIRDSLDSQAVIATAITEVFQMLRCDRCTFAWLDFERQEWTVVHESRQGYLPAFLRRTSRLPALVRAFERCELLQVDDIASLGNEELRQILEGRRHGAILASRIKTQSGTVGTILCGCTVPRRWTPTDVELLTGVSEQVVIALTQAELYQMAQTNAEEAEAALVALKKTQSQLIRSEKMSSLGQLVAGVAHEINNPVNFIFGNVEYATGYVRDLLELIKGYRAYLSPLPEELKELEEDLDWDFVQEDLIKVLRSMRGGAERIREIVKSLRTFSRLDEAERKSADIHSGLDSTLMILGSRLKAKGDRLPIAVTQDYGEIPAIECYPGLLNQVFLNLMGNAIDALESATHDPTWTGETPTLKICTHWLPDTEELEVQIRDNAMGIDAEVQSKLFDPFFTTKPVGKGTGLGLSMSYQIVVETHGGSLECESQPGKGALFTIRLPKEPAPQADSQASPTPDHSQKPIALQ